MTNLTTLRSAEILDLVKDKLLKQENNIEILAQVKYKSKLSILPSLKTESFILFNNKDENLLYVAQTENLDIKQILNIQDFKNVVNNLPNFTGQDFTDIFNKIDAGNTNKLKM